MMERQVDHMVRLVDDLLDVARISRGRIELRRQRAEVASVIRTAVEASRPHLDRAGTQLAVSIPPEPLTLDCDPVRLAQVFGNLLNNAAKYTDRGGQVWLKVRRDAGWVVVSVRDSGVGIPPEMLPKVFDLFTQVDRHAERAQGGLGIGLTLVKTLVEMHGGGVQARSDGAGRGSEFVVHLPLAPPAAAGEPHDEPVRRPAALAARRVLVVDDNRDAAESLGMILRLLGAEVRVAHSGPEALASLGDFEPSVALLDIAMPGMDGLELARRIREDPRFERVTLIALTARGQNEDRRRSLDAGFDHHLVKPADLGALESLLASSATGAQAPRADR
jgi:CheY-like chemotaxis protein